MSRMVFSGPDPRYLAMARGSLLRNKPLVIQKTALLLASSAAVCFLALHAVESFRTVGAFYDCVDVLMLSVALAFLLIAFCCC